MYQAPVAQKPGHSKKFILIAIGAFVAVVVAVILLFVINSRPSLADEIARAVQRQNQLVELTNSAQTSIQNSDLRKVNSDAYLFMISDLTELNTILKDAGQKNVPKDIKQAETDTTTAPKLQDAKLTGRYDSVYVEVLNQKIDAQQALLSEINTKTTSPAKRQTLSKIYDKLETIQKQLEGL